MSKRIINWFTYGIGFALMPLLIYLLLHYLSNTQLDFYACVPELLFFTIMICATCLWDLSDIKNKVGKDMVLNIFFSVLIILIVLCAILYGSVQFASISDNNLLLSNNKTCFFSLIIAMLSAMLGTIIQVIISRVEVKLYE